MVTFQAYTSPGNDKIPSQTRYFQSSIASNQTFRRLQSTSHSNYKNRITFPLIINSMKLKFQTSCHLSIHFNYIYQATSNKCEVQIDRQTNNHQMQIMSYKTTHTLFVLCKFLKQNTNSKKKKSQH